MAAVSNLISTAPGAFTNFYSLIAAMCEVQNPSVQCFPFELNQYEPDSYVMVSGIENHVIDWETIGAFSQIEQYSIYGKATVYTGAALSDDPTIAAGVLNATYQVFNTCVMQVAMSNREVPIFGSIPGVPDGALFRMQPEHARYQGMPGNLGGSESGWSGVIDWSFSLWAYITPA